MLAAAAVCTGATIAFVPLHANLALLVPSDAIGMLVLILVLVRRRGRCG